MDFRSTRIREENVLLKTKEEQKELAYKFSEGNKSLEDLLLFLWGKGINTYFCCGGHEFKGEEFYVNGKPHIKNPNDPYIIFDDRAFTKEQKEQVISKINSSNKGEVFIATIESEEEYYKTRKEFLEHKIITKIIPYEEYLKRDDNNKHQIAAHLNTKETWQPDFSFIKDIINEVKFGVVKNKTNNNPLEK